MKRIFILLLLLFAFGMDSPPTKPAEAPKPTTPAPAPAPKPAEAPKPATPAPAPAPKPAEAPKPATPAPAPAPKPAETPKPVTPAPAPAPKPAEAPKPATPAPAPAPKPAETPKPATPAPAPAKPAEPPKPPHKPEFRFTPDRAMFQSDKDLILRNIPTEPVVKPKEGPMKKVMIFDLNVDFGGHRSAVCANFAFTEMAKRTKAFEVVEAHEAKAFEMENLKQFGAVVFNNTVGNVFKDPSLRKNLEEFVKNGGGLLGLHSATEAFVIYGDDDEKNIGKDDWPMFGEMLGARGMVHRESDEKVFLKVEDPGHPLAQFFPKDGFFYRDEIPRVKDPYSRKKVRVLLSLDNAKSNLRRPPFGELKERPDEDYAVLWVKNFGKGRCCYIGLGHNATVFWDPVMLKLHLAAVQFVLGDLDGSAVPSIPPPPPAPAPPTPAPAPAPAPPTPAPAPAPAPSTPAPAPAPAPPAPAPAPAPTPPAPAPAPAPTPPAPAPAPAPAPPAPAPAPAPAPPAPAPAPAPAPPAPAPK